MYPLWVSCENASARCLRPSDVAMWRMTIRRETCRSSGTAARRHPESDPQLRLDLPSYEGTECKPFGCAIDRVVQTQRHRPVEPAARHPLRSTLIARLVLVRSPLSSFDPCLL